MNAQVEDIRSKIERLRETHERNLDKPMERGRVGHTSTKDIVSDIATHFYELGLNARKEESK